MRLVAVIPLFALLLSGCQTLKRLTMEPESTSAAVQALADDYTVEGTTTIDRQTINVRTVNSAVVTDVLRPGESIWDRANEFEAKIDATRGTIQFNKICYPTYDEDGRLVRIQLTGKSYAPPGTQYRIRSILNTTSKELY